jgi:zinc-binding alcohol dehydrogenase/oxidoreductase
VLVTGIGGGVALWAMQLVLAAGAEVFVTSGHDSKLNKAKALGAHGGVNYKETDWAKTLRQQAGGFDLVIDGAGGEGLAQLLSICLPGAKVVVYGGGRGVVPQLSPQLLFWKQISILGTSMGNDAEFEALMKMVVQHQIRPVVDSVFPLEDTAAAFAKMAAGEQFGKIIIRPV